ncbi:MAG TPA: UvrD-helicase domain-containing protein, partial [Anaerolineales bacterium]|nr:UvrD-helicase domain-containing protein [Anaerolineales bacterium]
MAEVVGFLREDAPYGEKETLKLLSRNLPKEFSIYVESPLHKKREMRYPDFIVLSNYGVIVLEVKDWVTIVNATPSGANIRTRKGDVRFEHNPVTRAREFAIILSNELKGKVRQEGGGEAIPWSYAAVLINLPSSVITQLHRAWGEEFVFGRDDLSVPDILLKRLKMTFPPERMRSLTKPEIDLVRATVYPIIEIEVPGRPTFVLDEQQEKIVAEPIRAEPAVSAKVKKQDDSVRQEELFESIKSKSEKEQLPETDEKLAYNTSIRLVRGFAGSGKSLVLIQRAKFLAAQYPDWKIGVFTFNKPLQEQLEKAFVGTTITPRTFHSLCMSLIPQQGESINLEVWLDASKFDFDIIRKLGAPAIRMEIDWIRDLNISSREEYLKVERRGIGKDLRLGSEQRNQVYDLLEAYQSHLSINNFWDWSSLSTAVDRELSAGNIKPDLYDAILIDEAQDWAPNWIRTINRMVNPEHGVIFLADDPSQSIYRSFSWKEKGIPVVGKTRWLRVPYRNTVEIYQAAYGMIAEHIDIQKSLSDEGELVKPDLSSAIMRHGTRPLIQKCRNMDHELDYIKNSIHSLLQNGHKEDQI